MSTCSQVTVTKAREGTDGPASLMDFIMVGGKDHQESLSIIDTISGVDLNASGNRRVHQTDRYDSGGLIVRRGQSFTFFLLLGKSLPSSTRFTSRATFNLGTRSLSKKHHTFQVDASAVVEGSRIRVELTTPADAPIGRWGVWLCIAHVCMGLCMYRMCGVSMCTWVCGVYVCMYVCTITLVMHSTCTCVYGFVHMLCVACPCVHVCVVCVTMI